MHARNEETVYVPERATPPGETTPQPAQRRNGLPGSATCDDPDGQGASEYSEETVSPRFDLAAGPAKKWFPGATARHAEHSSEETV